MTTQERIAMMKKTIEHENHEAMVKAQKAEDERREYVKKVLDLRDRIKAIIELGKCVQQKNEMPYVDFLDEQYHMGKVFMANGWSHRVGFMGHLRSPIAYVGFYAGGACGPWDFYTDGESVFLQHEETGSRQIPTTSKMKDFIDRFDDFENRFYTWFDKRFGEEK